MDRIFEEIRSSKAQEVVVLGAPASLRPALSRLPVLTIHHHYQSVHKAGFWLAFVKQKSDLLALAPEIAARAAKDAVLWLACSSKAFISELGEEVCHELLHKHGFQRAEATASDQNMTALRFERILSDVPSKSAPAHQPENSISENAKPEEPKTGGKHAATTRKTAPRAGRSSQNSTRPGHVRDTQARPSRPRSRGRSTSQSEAGNSDAGKQ